MQSDTTRYRLSVFQKIDGPLSKTISVDDDGHPHSDASECYMATGVAQKMSVQGLSGLANLITEMQSANALALGTILDREDESIVQVTTKNTLSGAADQIARTKDFVEFQTGQPGFLLIDFDQKGMSEDIRIRTENAGGVWELICSVLPELVSAGHLRRASTSAGLRNTETGELFEGSGGEHIYVAVRDVSDIPRATKVLHQRLWLAGLGWIWIGKVGQMLERSIVDQSVGSPERLAFEGAPVLLPPLEQSEEPRRPKVIEGDVIDTRKAIPILTPQEAARFEAMLQLEKNELKPAANAVRMIADDRLSEKLAKKVDIPIEEARTQIVRRHSGELLPILPLHFDDPSLGEVSVADVLLDPGRFVEQTLADPLEGASYGRCKAKVFRRRDSSLWINSFAHGGAQYNLVHDVGTLNSLLLEMDEHSDTNGFVALMASAHLEVDEETALLHAVRDQTGVQVGSLRQALARAKDSARHNAAFDDEDDERVTFPLPHASGELAPVLAQVDEVLRSDSSPIPPFRNTNHEVARVVQRPISGLHQLGAENDEATAHLNQVTIKTADDAEVTMTIESHMRFFKLERRRRIWARLQPTYVRAYSSWDASLLPRVDLSRFSAAPRARLSHLPFESQWAFPA